MSATVTCAGKDVLRGHISMPLSGIWWADLFLDDPGATSPPTGSVTLASREGLSFKGAVIAPGGVELDTAHVRVVGGAAGLSREVKGAFRSARLRDPLDAILRTTGEQLSGTVSATLLALELAFFTLGKYQARRAIGDLVRIAEERLGAEVSWRFLSDGTLWIGTESWTAATLPQSDLVTDILPAEGRTVVGVETLSLLPGVDLENVGKVRAVEHWVSPGALSTWAWT